MTPSSTAIGLVVADLKAAIAFYQQLGLEFTLYSDDHGEGELAGGLRLMLDTQESTRSYTPDWTPPSGSPRASLAFEYDSPEEVDAAYGALTGAGHRGYREPWDAFWGHRYATVLDPDGNGVDLYAVLPAPA